MVERINNKRQDPILIAAPPRCGTTMIAGLLHHHGVWIGRGRTTRYPGTNPDFVSENQDIKTILKAMGQEAGYENWTTPLPNITGSRVAKTLIERFVPDNTEWLLKTTWTLLLADFFIEQWPEARWLFLYRDFGSIDDSMARHPAMRKRPQYLRYRFIHALQERQRTLEPQLNKVLTVSVDAVIRRENDEIERLFSFLGIEPDEKVINNWIQPEIYHNAVND